MLIESFHVSSFKKLYRNQQRRIVLAISVLIRENLLRRVRLQSANPTLNSHIPNLLLEVSRNSPQPRHKIRIPRNLPIRRSPDIRPALGLPRRWRVIPLPNLRSQHGRMKLPPLQMPCHPSCKPRLSTSSAHLCITPRLVFDPRKNNLGSPPHHCRSQKINSFQCVNLVMSS